MLATNYSFGIERSAEKLAENDNDHRKWTNPLEIRLPNAPSMSVYCIYGVGKETGESTSQYESFDAIELTRNHWIKSEAIGIKTVAILETKWSRSPVTGRATPRIV